MTPASEQEPRQWTLRLRTPDLPLSLNDRKHHMAVWRAHQNLITQVWGACREANIPRLQRIHVRMEWTPRTTRRRDADNAVATLKGCLDGMRDAPKSSRWPAGRVGIVPDDTPEHVVWRQRVKLMGNAVTPPAARDLMLAIAASLDGTAA